LHLILFIRVLDFSVLIFHRRGNCSQNPDAAVVPVRHLVESRFHADSNGPAPRRHPLYLGGRIHSPGPALPLFVWLPLRLGDRHYIFGKAICKTNNPEIKCLCGLSNDQLLDSDVPVWSGALL
jgi:hypothetical protein